MQAHNWEARILRVLRTLLLRLPFRVLQPSTEAMPFFDVVAKTLCDVFTTTDRENTELDTDEIICVRTAFSTGQFDQVTRSRKIHIPSSKTPINTSSSIVRESEDPEALRSGTVDTERHYVQEDPTSQESSGTHCYRMDLPAAWTQHFVYETFRVQETVPKEGPKSVPF